MARPALRFTVSGMDEGDEISLALGLAVREVPEAEALVV